MARYCLLCDKKLSFFYRKPICKDCVETKYNHFFIRENILTLPDLPTPQLEELKKFGSDKILTLYETLLEKYTSDNIMTETEIANLEKVSNFFGITAEENKHDDVILPHKVKNYLDKHGHLPSVNSDMFESFNLHFNGEELYNCGYCSLYALKSYSRYIPGSRGVSVYGFKVGRVQGQRVSETLPAPKSEGKFVMTDKGFYYIPNTYGNMVKLPYNKIINYGGDDEFLHIYKNGRQSPYLFFMSLGNIKISLLGLDYLKGQA